VDSKSLFERAKELERLMGSTLSSLDVAVLSRSEQKLIHDIKRLLTDIRLDVRDYEFADTRAEQETYGRGGRERLEQLQRTILAASEHNLFGPADVAQITAYLQQLVVDLR
jgi:hypothetical protein